MPEPAFQESIDLTRRMAATIVIGPTVSAIVAAGEASVERRRRLDAGVEQEPK